MSKAASIIEINGNQYDAKSGDVIGSVKRFARQVKDQSSSRVIDGFVRKPAVAIAAAPKILVRARSKKPDARAIHRSAEHSRTLMRNIVNKPSYRRPSSISTPIQAALSQDVKDDNHGSSATTIVKNAKVRRFGDLSSASHSLNQETPGLTSLQTRSSNHATASSPSSSANVGVLPGLVASASQQRLERMLDEALMRADAHKNRLAASSKNPINWLRRHWITFILATAAILVLAGLFIWQSVPAVSMKVASYRAGLSTTLPTYMPDSFKVTSPIDYSGGAVSIHYADKVNPSQVYTLSERKSNWDSASLAANALGPNVKSGISQIGGTTVYVYGADNNATWVNNGIWYTVDNHANLSSDQLLQIAQNM